MFQLPRMCAANVPEAQLCLAAASVSFSNFATKSSVTVPFSKVNNASKLSDLD